MINICRNRRAKLRVHRQTIEDYGLRIRNNVSRICSFDLSLPYREASFNRGGTIV
jgi:hypothetical protein